MCVLNSTSYQRHQCSNYEDWLLLMSSELAQPRLWPRWHPGPGRDKARVLVYTTYF